MYYDKINTELKFIEALHKDYSEKTLDKEIFYKKYFGRGKKEDIQYICLEYLKGIQFVMLYYFRGCPTWTWFYPYFMSPFLGDVIDILQETLETDPDKLDFQFDKDTPFKPFTQLAFILPKASIDLLPKPFYSLVNHDAVAHYFPDNYEFEPFDGIREYMWIAKIDVID